MLNRRHFLALLTLSPLILTACTSSPTFTKLPAGSVVVALGDSLTFGFGADKADNYPTALAQKTGWNIINQGINGDTTADVLARLDGVFAENPKLVLLGIGGNDVLKRVNSAETRTNLVNIIKQLTDKNIPVVLIAEPHFSASALFGKASDNPIYEEVAKELTVPLFANGWSKILSDNSLKSDQIHANGAGYKQFADMLYEFLQEIGYV